MGAPSQTTGADVQAITLAALHHFGVARYDGHAGQTGGFGHRSGHALQIAQGQALFQHKGHGQAGGPGAHHGQIVGGAVHRQTANVAARKKQWRHHMRIGGHDQIVSCRRLQGSIEHRAIVACILPTFGPGALERWAEDLLDQLISGAAACAMAHVDATLLLVERTQVVSAGIHAVVR